jgi:hypothetical protein
MTDPRDRSPARVPRHQDRDRNLASTARDELTRLRGKTIGVCAVCGRPVFFEHNFTRMYGRLVHVRCPISARTPAPPAGALDPSAAREIS